MIRYLDTSVIVKRYVHEVGTPEVLALFEQTVPLATSRIAWVETNASLARRFREGALKPAARARITKSASADFTSLRLVEVTSEILDSAAQLCSAHPLRSLDSVHLASALWLRAEIDNEVVFFCADRAMVRVAGAAGLDCVVPGSLER